MPRTCHRGCYTDDQDDPLACPICGTRLEDNGTCSNVDCEYMPPKIRG